MRIKKVNALQWLLEPLEEEPGFFQRRMFGCEAAYLEGRMILVLADSEEPWNGLMVCTSREHHESLQRQFPALVPHEILGKWLYISQTHDDFESVAGRLVDLAKRRDGRIGIESKPKKPKKKAAGKKPRAASKKRSKK